MNSVKDRNERFEAWAKAHRIAFSLACIPVVIVIVLIAFGVVWVTLGRFNHHGPSLRDRLPSCVGMWIGIMLGYHGRWLASDIRTWRTNRTES